MPVRVQHHMTHRGTQYWRRPRRLTDHDAHRHDRLITFHHLQSIRWHIYDDIPSPQLLGEPAPALHILDDLPHLHLGARTLTVLGERLPQPSVVRMMWEQTA